MAQPPGAVYRRQNATPVVAGRTLTDAEFASYVAIIRPDLIRYAKVDIGLESEDVVAQTMLRLAKARHSYRHVSWEGFCSYVYRVLWNEGTHFVNRRVRTKALVDAMGGELMAASGPRPDEEAIELVYLEQRRVALAELLQHASLSPMQRICLTAFYHDEPTEITAARIGKTNSCVRAHRSEAIMKVRKLVANPNGLAAIVEVLTG